MSVHEVGFAVAVLAVAVVVGVGVGLRTVAMSSSGFWLLYLAAALGMHVGLWLGWWLR